MGLSRRKKVFEAIVEEYGDDADDLRELVDTLLEAYPEVNDRKVIDYVVEMLVEYDGDIDVDELVDNFSREWGVKT